MTGDQLDLIDPHGLVEQQERRLTVAELAEAVMGETDRKNTVDAYRQDWARWTEFVASANAQGMDLTITGAASDSTPAQALAVFAKWLAIGGRTARGNYVQPHAPESIRRRITGVQAGWREAGVEYPRGVSTNARRWVDDYENKLVADKKPTGRGQAPVLFLDGTDSDDMVKIAAATDLTTLAGRRDLALITMAVAIGARSAEISFLDVSDITPGERGVNVHVRRSKKGTRRPAVPFGQREISCPVLSWRRWQEASGIIVGPAFRAIDRHGNLGGRLSPEGCSDAVERAGKRAGIKGLTIHSCRAALATAGTRARKSPEEIAAQGGWSIGSTAMHRYIRSVRVWQSNVLDGIGL